MHIALIAMSGVRAASEELNAIGMTMPGFVERSKVIASLPSLSLLTLAGMTPDAARGRNRLHIVGRAWANVHRWPSRSSAT